MTSRCQPVWGEKGRKSLGGRGRKIEHPRVRENSFAPTNPGPKSLRDEALAKKERTTGTSCASLSYLRRQRRPAVFSEWKKGKEETAFAEDKERASP